MAFGLEEMIIGQELRNLGHKVTLNRMEHRLIVDDTYEYCYTNSRFFNIGEKKSIGVGHQEFLKLLANANVSKPAIYFY